MGTRSSVPGTIILRRSSVACDSLYAISWLGIPFVFVGDAFFSAGGNVVRAGLLEDFLCAFDLIAVFRVDGNKNVTLFNFPLVLFGFVP